MLDQTVKQNYITKQTIKKLDLAGAEMQVLEDVLRQSYTRSSFSTKDLK